MGDVNELEKIERNKTMANLPGSIKNLNTLLGEQLLDGGGSGGGGSSDFSFAQVTFENNSGSLLLAYMPFIIQPDDALETENHIPMGNSVAEMVLYKGSASINCTSFVPTYTVSVSGNATEKRGYVSVTGDCTITIS